MRSIRLTARASGFTLIEVMRGYPLAFLELVPRRDSLAERGEWMRGSDE